MRRSRITPIPAIPGFRISARSRCGPTRGRGYIRVDWFTPDALPNWGDGRLTILGTEGYIELRKYVDVGGRAGTDTLILVNGDRCEAIDARDCGPALFRADHRGCAGQDGHGDAAGALLQGDGAGLAGAGMAEGLA
jgi:hypothetical protein